MIDNYCLLRHSRGPSRGPHNGRLNTWIVHHSLILTRWVSSVCELVTCLIVISDWIFWKSWVECVLYRTRSHLSEVYLNYLTWNTWSEYLREVYLNYLKWIFAWSVLELLEVNCLKWLVKWIKWSVQWLIMLWLHKSIGVNLLDS